MSVSIDQWRAQGRVVNLLGRDIFFADNGDSGRGTIFLIHGFPTSSWDWTPVWETLGASHRLIALDMLGFGFSEKPRSHQYTIMEQADLCEALVRHLRLEEFDVFAHDYGTTVAQELLARQNEGSGAGTWRSLCLLNGGLFPETHKAKFIQKVLLSPAGPLVNAALSKRAFDRSFSSVFGKDTQPSPDELDSYWRIINYNHGKMVFHRLISYMSDRKEHRERWVGALRQSRVPLGVINGSVDPVSGAHMVARYREIVSSDHFIVELPTVGHYPHVEDSDAVLDAYQRFLKTV